MDFRCFHYINDGVLISYGYDVARVLILNGVHGC